MRILFDLMALQPLGGIEFHGGGEYAKVVFKNLICSMKENEQVDIFFDPLRAIDEYIVALCEQYNVMKYECISQADIEKVLVMNEYDVFYSALPHVSYSKINIPSRTKFVFTQHGLRGLELFDDKYQIKYQSNMSGKLKIIIKKIFREMLFERRRKSIESVINLTENRTLITDSQHSKNSILWFFPHMESREIKVVACPQKFYDLNNEDEHLFEKFNISEKKYILLVSCDRWEKNAYRAVRALNSLLNNKKKTFKDYKVLMVGVTNPKIFNGLIDEDNKSKFVMKGYINNEELQFLYKHAYLFLYPSLNEGYGYPPIEAMRYDTLSVCAADSSITEVCQDAVLYFRPDDINEMAIRILEGFDDEVRNSYQEKMKRRYTSIVNEQKSNIDNIIKIIKQ